MQCDPHGSNMYHAIPFMYVKENYFFSYLNRILYCHFYLTFQICFCILLSRFFFSVPIELCRLIAAIEIIQTKINQILFFLNHNLNIWKVQIQRIKKKQLWDLVQIILWCYLREKLQTRTMEVIVKNCRQMVPLTKSTTAWQVGFSWRMFLLE